jgi:hypothetical protein
VTEVLTEPIAAPNVWSGSELTDTERWIVPFTEEDLTDFERALALVSAKHFREVTDLSADDFPLPHFRDRLEDLVDRLEHSAAGRVVNTPFGRSPGTSRAERGRSRAPVARITARASIRCRPAGLVTRTARSPAHPVTVAEVRMFAPARSARSASRPA